MATTTNYAWETPDDTDLVKDGAAAIRTLGSSIDTTTKALNPSTTLGDIEYRSATANTNTRLPIGTSGQVLSVSGGVPAWVTSSSGGMTLLSTTTLSGATTTISSIDQTYTDLQIFIFGYTNGSANLPPTMRPNASTTIVDYAGSGRSGGSNTLAGSTNDIIPFGLTNGDRTSALNSGSCTIKNYSSTTSFKPFNCFGNFKVSTGDASFNIGGGIKTTSAITSLVFFADGGTFTAGTVLIYGVK